MIKNKILTNKLFSIDFILNYFGLDKHMGIKRIAFFLPCMLTFWCSNLFSQTPTVVLPGDGGSTQTSAPQGAFRYQRGFYLMTPKELMGKGLMVNDTINCIGFTIGEAQSDTTKGKFKVYLQNTSDTTSRYDTTWIVQSGLTTNSFYSNGIFPGDYEWQVKTNCSPYSQLQNFTSFNSNSCQPPTSLKTSSITSTGALLNWVAPIMGVVKYEIEHRRSDSINWIKDSSMTTSFMLSGLQANKQYFWRVRTRCTGESSDFTYLNFYTLNQDDCNEPTGLTVAFTTDSSARLRWTAAAESDYYTVQWRQKGSVNWLTTAGSADSIIININIDSGTTYQWRVRSHCGVDSVGSFVNGPDFITLGTTICYTPGYFSVDSISLSTAKFVWDAVPGATSYELRYRAKNFINWENAIHLELDSMQLVHDDSICIPDQLGPYLVPFKGTTIDTFVYTGGGIYVAWEYKDSLGVLSTFNSTLSTKANTVLKGSMGQDSIVYLMSFVTPGDSSAAGLDTILNAIPFRPETRLCASSLRDSVEILSVYALGKFAPSYTSYPISAVIRNYLPVDQSYPVSLTVKDVATNVIRYTETKDAVILADSFGIVEFTGWNPTILETDSILISTPARPGENVLNNNQGFYIQMVTNNIVSYADGSQRISEAGTDTAAGLTLSRHLMDGCGKINGVQVYLTRSSIGHSIYAIALDSAKSILAQSPSFIPDSNYVNQYHTFYFPDTRLLNNELYYIGLAQTASPAGYFPVGVQYEAGIIRDSAYWRGKINADSVWHQPAPGRLMIRAQLIPGFPIPNISGEAFLCEGATDTLIASSVIARYADSVIAYSSQAGLTAFGSQEALGTPDVYPMYGISASAWFSEIDTGKGFLTLKFPNPDSVNFVDVFETYNPGSVDSIYLMDEMGTFHLVSAGQAAALPPVAKRSRYTFPLSPYKVSAVRIVFNLGLVFGFNAIDAVCIGRITTPGTFDGIIWNGPGGYMSTDDTISITTPGVYKLSINYANGCGASDSISIITPVKDTADIYFNTDLSHMKLDSTLCNGDSIWIKSNKTGNNFWKSVAFPDSVLSISDSIRIKNAGQYYVVYDDGTGCGTTNSDTITVNYYTPVNVNISGVLIICPGESTTLRATAGFASYLWSNSDVADSTVVNISDLQIVTVVDNFGCKGADSVTTILGTTPVPMITGVVSFCPGDSTILHATSGFAQYAWSNGSDKDSIWVKDENNYTVTVTNSEGCKGSADVSTFILSPPVAMIIGEDGFCPLDSIELLGVGGDFNSWSTGQTTESIFVKTSGNYLLTVTDANGCTDTVSKYISEFNPPVPFISGTLSFCAGSVTTLNAGLGYSSYLWSTGETSPTILVSQIGIYSVIVSDANGCLGSVSDTVTKDGAIPNVPGPITGSQFGMCNIGDPSMYSIDPVKNSTCYIWKVPQGVTIVHGFLVDSNVFSNVIKVVFDNTFVGGFIEVAAHNDCGSSPTWQGSSLYVSASPGSVPGSISGPNSGVCKLQSVMYSIPAINDAIGYEWTVPLGVNILSGQNTNAIKVSFATSFRPADICVRYSTACGTSPFECISITATPQKPLTITGLSVVCPNERDVYFSIQPVLGATEYFWFVPTGAVVDSGQGTTTIKVRFGTHAGLVTVFAINNCGSSSVQFLAVNFAKCFQSKRKEHSLRSDDITVFPNPSNGIIQLKVNPSLISGKNEVQIMDGVGRLVLTIFVNEAINTLDLSRLPKGLYVLKYSNDLIHHSSKIILQ